ncbi:hypothetical protein M404DRAFT_999353 [Pisolithus tinctorius Marx 270]|uniref:Uncharacterized protein n=1 Tax=Pisolithus tinctorius Marx 270 TaxID=870435 RepID=A0A0C3K931_PISTI|nr:hypothetical protein M404DRAFT_999353 [Pisolithus tinctorius Marx 270]
MGRSVHCISQSSDAPHQFITCSARATSLDLINSFVFKEYTCRYAPPQIHPRRSAERTRRSILVTIYPIPVVSTPPLTGSQTRPDFEWVCGL